MGTNLDNLITNQEYIDDEIVKVKRANADYTIQVSPEFVVDGETLRLLIDGHHSLAAAMLDGVDPEVIELDKLESDSIALLEDGNVDDFLAEHANNAGHWLYATTNQFVW